MADLSATEVARRVGVSRSDIVFLCRRGLIQARKAKGRWRIPEEKAPKTEEDMRRFFRLNRKPISTKTRKLVLERAGYRCERCGSTQDLQIHHKIPRWALGSNDPDNLQVLCRHCHMELEGLLPVVELTKRWLTTKEAARRLSVKPNTVARWCSHGWLRHSRKEKGHWLISDEEVRRKRR